MRYFYLFFVLLACLMCEKNATAQSSQDAAIPIWASVSSSPAAITLSWTTAADASSYTLKRKEYGFPAWTTLATFQGNATNSYTDTSVVVGKRYEYGLSKSGTIGAYNVVLASIEGDLIENRGAILLLVEDSVAALLNPELTTWQKDVEADGWIVKKYTLSKDSSHFYVKSIIQNDYNMSPSSLKSVFLVGAIAAPYSGNIYPDGHTDHQGAWGCDGYYGTVAGSWTDMSVNNASAARVQNQNLIGDGKFDQNVFPAEIKLRIGRLDFSHINPNDFGVSSTYDLYQRYFTKNHLFRTAQYKPQNQAIIDDNFGYFNGEAFAANGWRAGYSLVGNGNVVAGDIFTDTDSQTYLVGYGCGGGWYQGASGIGDWSNFANDSVNITFGMLFGSYFGDWDYENNPFMFSALAGKGAWLTCCWAGRPNWYLHSLNLGHTIGDCACISQNNSTVYPSNLSARGVHTALLGDPTLRAHNLIAPSNLVSTQNCNQIELSWAASPDATAGYYVYRSNFPNFNFTRLTNQPITSLSFIDNNPFPNTTNYYQIKAVQLENTVTGTYYNSSPAIRTSRVFTPLVAPVITFPPPPLCSDLPYLYSIIPDPNVNYQWYNVTNGNYQLIGTGNSLNYTANQMTMQMVLVANNATCADTNSFNLTFALCAATEDAALKAPFITYPNPAKDFLSISFDTQLSEPYQVKIFDVTGKELAQYQNQSEVFDIPVADFAKGMYWLQVSHKGEQWRKQWVKE